MDCTKDGLHNSPSTSKLTEALVSRIIEKTLKALTRTGTMIKRHPYPPPRLGGMPAIALILLFLPLLLPTITPGPSVIVFVHAQTYQLITTDKMRHDMLEAHNYLRSLEISESHGDPVDASKYYKLPFGLAYPSPDEQLPASGCENPGGSDCKGKYGKYVKTRRAPFMLKLVWDDLYEQYAANYAMDMCTGKSTWKHSKREP